MHMLKTELIKV